MGMSTLSRKLQLTEWKGKWSMNVTPDNQVTFLSASRQVFRTTSALLMSDEDVKARKLDEAPPPQLVSKREQEKLERMEKQFVSAAMGQDLLRNIAALKLQRLFR